MKRSISKLGGPAAREGFKIASPEEIAFRQGFVDGPQLEKAIVRLGKSDYGRYLRAILAEG